MSKKTLPEPDRRSRPPLLSILAGLLLLASMTVCISFAAIKNDSVFRTNLRSMVRVWDERVALRALPEQEMARRDSASDRASLDQLRQQYRGLYFLLTLAIASLAVLVMICFFSYRAGLIAPLRRLEDSCRELLKDNLDGHIWGLDRDDQFGSLARTISDIRNRTQRLSDMVLETEDGKQHIRFEGRSGATFNTLIAELIEAVEALRARGIEVSTLASSGQERLHTFNDVTARQSQSLEEAVDSARTQLATVQGEWTEKLNALFHQNNQVTLQAKAMADQFRKDIETIREISIITGTNVRETLAGLNASNNTLRFAADKSLEAGSLLSRQTVEITDKLVAATNLLRASGKVMSETSEAARTRLMEAVDSVSRHDDALRAFLSDTMEKTGRIATLFDTLSANTQRAGDTVERFDARMAQFEHRSAPAFALIEQSGAAISGAALQLNEAHSMMSSSMQTMRGHTDTLAQILSAIRNEYVRFTSDWASTMAEATPAIRQLRETSSGLQNELRGEWAAFAEQSRQMFDSLEADIRTLNARTEIVTTGAERLINHLAVQSQRLGDSASQFDLQIASMTQRLEVAAGTVVESNSAVLNSTARQISDIQTAVQDMVQRLTILSQLTGTLGSVAGQLGQIVPALGDTVRYSQPIVAPAGTDAATTDRLEKISTALQGSMQAMHSESETVRRQIGSWVEMITSGYKRLSSEIGRIDASIAGLAEGGGPLRPGAPPKPAPEPGRDPAAGESDILPAIRLVHQGLTQGVALQENVIQQMHMLRSDLKNVGTDIAQTVKSLKALEGKVSEGFSRLQKEDSGAGAGPVEVQVDMSRVETASAVLESMLGTLQNHSQDLVGRLSDITTRLSTIEEEKKTG